jgi:hypothetical protein
VTEEPPSYPPPPPGGYGYPPPGPGYPPPQAAVGTNGMAIASLVCSLFGWLCVIGPILGLIFGFMALGQIRQTGQRGRGMAIAGIVIGAIALVLFIVGGIFWGMSGSTSHTYSGAPAVM